MSIFRFLLLLLALVVSGKQGRDFYKILGVPRNASQRQIKKAHRANVKKWHPDKNQGNEEEASGKFVDISDAYEVLSDKEKKSKYDRFGEDGLKDENVHHQNYNNRGGFHHQRQTFHHHRQPVKMPANFLYIGSHNNALGRTKSIVVGDENLQGKVGDDWPTVMYLYKNVQNLQFNNDLENLMLTFKKKGIRGLSMDCGSKMAMHPMLGLVRMQGQDKCDIWMELTGSEGVFDKFIRGNSVHLLALITGESGGMKVKASIDPTNMDKIHLQRWFKEYIPNEVTVLRTRDDFFKYIRKHSEKPKIILLDNPHHISEMEKLAFTHSYADYGMIYRKKPNMFKNSVLPSAFRDILPPLPNDPHVSIHIYDITLEDGDYREGVGLEYITESLPNVVNLFIEKFRNTYRNKIGKSGRYSGLGTIYWLNSQLQAEGICGPKDSHVCVLYIGEYVTADLRKVSAQFVKEKGVRFGIAPFSTLITQAMPGVLPGSYVAIKPKRKIFRVSPEDMSLSTFVEKVVDFDGLSPAAEGIERMAGVGFVL